MFTVLTEKMVNRFSINRTETDKIMAAKLAFCKSRFITISDVADVTFCHITYKTAEIIFDILGFHNVWCNLFAKLEFRDLTTRSIIALNPPRLPTT